MAEEGLVLQLENVTKRFGAVQALRGVSLDARAGEVAQRPIGIDLGAQGGEVTRASRLIGLTARPDGVVAENVIHHDPSRPSRLVLTVVAGLDRGAA